MEFFSSLMSSSTVMAIRFAGTVATKAIPDFIGVDAIKEKAGRTRL
jgi:hypothetical protein